MRAQLYSLRELPVGCVSMMARPRGGDWLIDEVTALREAGVHVLVSLLTPWRSIRSSLQRKRHTARPRAYPSFPSPSSTGSVPPLNDRTLTLLQQLDDQRTQGKHIALHCRQGLGRAALMAASLLVLAGWSPEKAFEHLSRIRGYPVPETEEQRAWVASLATRYLVE